MINIICAAGNWRYFNETMFNEPLEDVKIKGVTFEKVVHLAQSAGVKVEAFRTTESTLADFRRHVLKCTSGEDQHIITSYDRAALKQVRMLFVVIFFLRSLCGSVACVLFLCMCMYVCSFKRLVMNPHP